MFLQAASLLELPELALQEVAKHLSQPDLAGCMQTCSALNALFRPRLSALVSARHLGKKWVMRSCGRALFRALAECWEAGEMKVQMVGEPIADRPHTEMQRFLALKAAQNGLAVRRAFAAWKARGIGLPDGSYTYYEDVVYLCNLAESKGFLTAATLLDKVCVDYCVSKSIPLEILYARRAVPHTGPGSMYFELSKGSPSQQWATFRLFNNELLSGMWFVTFLVNIEDWYEFNAQQITDRLELLVGGQG